MTAQKLLSIGGIVNQAIVIADHVIVAIGDVALVHCAARIHVEAVIKIAKIK